MAVSRNSEMWKFPRPHQYQFSFGLSAENTSKASTILPLLISSDAGVDLETVKTNPANDDFATYAGPTVYAGSTIPKISVIWQAWSPNEMALCKFATMDIHTAFKERLDAADKKTGTTVKNLIEMQYETTDLRAYPLYNGTKLFEGHMVKDFPSDVPGLTTDTQPEGVAFDMDTYFSALHYYSNKEMLRKVTGPMRFHQVNGLSGNVPSKLTVENGTAAQNPICKFANPYTFCGLLFHVPQVDTIWQPHNSGSTTAIEHLTVTGIVRFSEFNPDFNFARA